MNLFIYLVSTLCLHIQSFTVIDANKRNIITDNLLLTRCQLICSLKQDLKHESSHHSNCDMEMCVENTSELVKFGACPSAPKTAFESMCWDVCKGMDYNCPGVQKCCPHECGWSCQDPDGLDSISALPPIPQNITIREVKAKSIDISWEIVSKQKPQCSILYVLESRSHIGKHFAEYKLGDWNWMTFQHRYDAPINVNGTPGIRTVGQVKLRPGRWYEFRVAAVNENGSRGYSNYTQAYQLQIPPNSPKGPKILKTTKILIRNSTYSLIVAWTTQRSDLPIIRYKICWSLFLRNTMKNHSLYMEHDYVNEPQKYYEIKNLLPDHSYFIQLQAISMYGKKRLISDKKSKVVNTTVDKDVVVVDEIDYDPAYFSEHESRSLREHRSKDKLINKKAVSMSIRVLPDFHCGMIIKVLWKKHSVNDVIVELCVGNESCFNSKSTSNGAYYSIRTKRNSHIFTDLKYGTNYTVRLTQLGKNNSVKRSRTIKHFKTPTCENHKRAHPYIELQC